MSQHPVVNPEPLPPIRTVPLGNALAWLRIGAMLYKSYLLMWGVLFVIYFIILHLFSLLGVVGSIFTFLVAPVFSGGLLLGCQAIERKQDLEINHLFAGFKRNAVQLMKLGWIYLAVILVLSMIVSMSIDPEALQALPKGEPLTSEQLQSLSKPLLLLGLLLIPALMAFWFAPALVTINQLQPWDGLKLSFSACIKNILPLTFYSFLIGIFFTMLLTISQLFGAFGESVLLVLLLFTLLPMAMTSLYVSYRDIFQANDQ